ncbi:MAG: SRPBCC family protein [Candidatus Eisenbacteria bacterium]
MKQFIRTLTFLVAAMVLLLGIAGILGWMTPRRHHAASEVTIAAPRDSVWAVLADMEHSPAWRRDVTAVKRLADRDGHPVWEQQSRDGAYALVLTTIEPPVRLVATVADTSQGFGGTWTWALAPAGTGTRVTLSEDGFVDHPMFRFLARYVFGLHTAQRASLRDLGRRFGQELDPARVN